MRARPTLTTVDSSLQVRLPQVTNAQRETAYNGISVGATQNNPRLLSVLFCLGAETGKDSAFATPKRKASQNGATLLPSQKNKITP